MTTLMEDEKSSIEEQKRDLRNTIDEKDKDR